HTDQLQATPMAGTEDGATPFISPDGKWVAFWAKGTLEKKPLTGEGPVTLICQTASILGGNWGSDDNIVFSRDQGGLWQVSASGGSPKSITTLDINLGK